MAIRFPLSLPTNFNFCFTCCDAVFLHKHNYYEMLAQLELFSTSYEPVPNGDCYKSFHCFPTPFHRFVVIGRAEHGTSQVRVGARLSNCLELFQETIGAILDQFVDFVNNEPLDTGKARDYNKAC